MADLIGQRLGQYEITALLGEGGMAAVYRARRLNLKGDVAIKIIKSGLMGTDKLGEFSKRFEREAETIATLSHLHILKLFDYGQQGDLVYLVMELLTGGSLADLIHQGKLPLAQASKLLEQIASALDYAHRQGIIHRDLKPQNVLLDSDGNAFLTDFGIAKILTETTALTASGTAMGTPAYMSPEQWLARPLDGRTDLYALGIIVYEMLSGRLPFNADTPFGMMHMHVYDPPPSFRALRPDLPLSVEKVINKALAKDPMQRFQSAGDLAAAFKIALTGQTPSGVEIAPVSKDEVGVTAPHPTPLATESVTPPVRRGGRTGLLAVGAIVLVAVVGVLLIVLSLGGQNNPTATPTIQTPVAAAATAMQTASATVTTTLTPTLPTQTPQPTLTTLPRSSTATETRTAMVTWTATAAPSVTPNLATRAAATIAMRETATANAIASFTHTPTNTPTITLTPTETPNEEQTLAAIVAATETANAIASFTKTPTPTNTATFTPTATLTATPTPTYTVTLTPTLTSTPTATLAPALGPGCPFEMMSQELAAACTGAYAGKVVTVGGSQDADAAISLQNSFKEFEDWTGIKVVYTGDTNFASVITAKVEGGQAPDIADFSVPNLLKVFAKQGKIIDVGKFMNPDWLKKNYAKFWLDLAIVPGVSGNITGGVWGRGFVKSLVWYPKKAFDASGYKVPTTWDEMIALSDQIVNEGKTPWCIGIESGSATGWPATDWVEDILLRTAPPEVYDNWATPSDLSKRVKFTDPIVKAAVQKMDIIWKNDKYVYGGSKSIPVTSFSDSANAIFTVPPKCYLHRQANFVTLYFPNLRLGVDYDFFYFPPIDPKYGKPILGGADIWGLFNDRPEARAVIDWLSRGESVKTLVGDGFTLAPQNDFKPEWYANDAQRKISALMAQATVLRLDGSDQMPAEVGTDSFWTGMTSYYAGSTDLNTMLRQIDATWPTN